MRTRLAGGISVFLSPVLDSWGLGLSKAEELRTNLPILSPWTLGEAPVPNAQGLLFFFIKKRERSAAMSSHNSTLKNV
jgi:hypothetical protein